MRIAQIDQDRAEVAAARQVQAHEAAAGQREGVPLDHQVAGEEDRDDDLGELAGLDGPKPAMRDPDPARRNRAGKNTGRISRTSAPTMRDVGVALQDAVVLEEDQHADEEGDAERGVQISWLGAGGATNWSCQLVSRFDWSSRQMSTSPRPLSSVAIGSISGSA